MKLETFFDNFEVLAEAPNGVKKLRELILQLAVRGKLVAQDEKDEPTSVLLKSIRDQIKKSGNSIKENEMPYALPKIWEWVRLGDILAFEYGDALPKSKRAENAKYPVYGSNGIVGYHDEFLIDKPGIIVGRKGSCGALNVSFEPFWATDVSYYVIPPIGIDLKFAYILLKSLNLERLGKGIKPGLNRNEAYQVVTSLPPYNEQHRIVSKVDQLMSLCDELEARQQKKRESRAHLNSAALDRLLAGRAPGEFAQGWRRISDNFDLLYDAPENVGALEKAILQLAVMGKLVAQDEKDEPASVLLGKIKAEKEWQVKEKKFKKNKPIPSIKMDEGWYELPKGWLWYRIGEAFLTSSGSTPNRSKLDYFINGTENWVKTTDLNNGTVLSCEEKITLQAAKDCNLKYYPIGTVCIGMYGGAGTIGKSGVLGMETTINQSVFGIYPNKHINSEFFHLYIKSIRAKWMMFAAGLRRDPNINGGIIDRMIFPLPPLNEQNRIVSKVRDLMSLCDELEAALLRSQAESEKLMEAVVGGMLAG